MRRRASVEPAPPDENLLAAHCQTLPALGAAALENDAAILRGHANPESVRLATTARIRLKRALTLHDLSGVPRANPLGAGTRRTSTAPYLIRLNLKRTANVNEAFQAVSMYGRLCYSRLPRSAPPDAGLSHPTKYVLWSLPRDFHTCGKNCGKSWGFVPLLNISPDFFMFSAGAKPEKLEKWTFPRPRPRRSPEFPAPPEAKVQRRLKTPQ